MQFSPSQPVPVFPLPNLVLFPHAVVPLRVFELRYRTMVRDALTGERLIALGLLKPGWERDYHGSPEFYPLGCLARFEEVEWLPDDCYSLRVRGVSRVAFGRIVREYPYRVARLELLKQEPYSEDDPLVLSEKHVLLELYRRLLPEGAAPSPGPSAPAAVEPGANPDPEPAALSPPGAAARSGSELSFEALVNALCMVVETEPLDKLELLGLDSVIERGRKVREIAGRRGQGRPRPAPGSGEHN